MRRTLEIHGAHFKSLDHSEPFLLSSCRSADGVQGERCRGVQEHARVVGKGGLL